MIKYETVSMTFDSETFASDLRKFKEDSGMTIRELDEMLGIVLFSIYLYPHSDQLPTTRNLILLCNMMDVDPRKYFILEDKG